MSFRKLVDLHPDGVLQVPAGAADKIGPAHAAVEERISGEELSLPVKPDAPGGVAGQMNNLDGGPADGNSLPILQEPVGRGGRQGPQEQAQLRIHHILEERVILGVDQEGNTEMILHVFVGPDMIHMPVGVENQDGLELEAGDGGEYFFRFGARVDDGALERFGAIDQAAIRLQSPDDHDLVFHHRYLESMIKTIRPRVNPSTPRREWRGRASHRRTGQGSVLAIYRGGKYNGGDGRNPLADPDRPEIHKKAG